MRGKKFKNEKENSPMIDDDFCLILILDRSFA